MKKILLGATLIACTLALPARAALIQLGPQDFPGSGLGSVYTVLTLHSNTGSESGSVSWNGTNDVITGGSDVQTGASQTLTRTLGEVGLTDADDLRVVFNAAEPNSAAFKGITLVDLVLNIFSSDGSLLFTSGSLPAPIPFADTETGTGNAGFVFGIDPAQLAAAQLAFNDPSNRLGLSASIINAQGGLETFFVAFGGSTPVPAPAGLALMGLGLLGIAAVRRRA